MEITIFCILTSVAAILFKFFYGKSIGLKIKIIIKSYLCWYGLYHIVNTHYLKLKSFYKISNICNVIFVMAFCILAINFIFRSSVI